MHTLYSVKRFAWRCRAHGVPLEEVGDGVLEPGDSSALWFPTLEGALRWCEGSLLRVAQGQDLCSLDRPRMTLAEILVMHMQHPQVLNPPPPGLYRLAALHHDAGNYAADAHAAPLGAATLHWSITARLRFKCQLRCQSFTLL